ncbi:MAG: tyrosine-type recombinase/integrase [Ignavibacteriales bacterium]|nr:tyrosine-type recombinase/integrase [Ignavibacteriales bacterium]
MDEILKNISADDIERLKLLLSIIPGSRQKEVVTLRVFTEEYINLIQHNKSASYLRSVKIALNYLIEYFSIKEGKPGLQKPIDSIELKDVENFIIYLQQKVKKGYVVYYRNLKAAFNKAREWGYVSENFFIKVKLPKRQKIAPVFINSDQLSVISDQIKSETVKDFVMIAFYTGMRLDEIVNLRWKNVDLQNRVITVGDENFTTKGRTQRFIPMSEEAFEILVRREKSKVKETPSCILPLIKGEKLFDYVFCKSDGEKFTGDYFSRRFKKACRNAGIEKSIHFHSLRHSFASSLVQKGVPLYTIKELLGHASISTTEIYSHLNMDSLREAIGKLDGRIPKDEVKEQNNTIKNEVKIFRINSGEKR